MNQTSHVWRPVAAFGGRATICALCRHPEEAHASPTVKRVDIFGNVIDTHRTEADLNGWREQQGRLI